MPAAYNSALKLKGLFGFRLFFPESNSGSVFQNLVCIKADSHGFWDGVTVRHSDQIGIR